MMWRLSRGRSRRRRQGPLITSGFLGDDMSEAVVTDAVSFWFVVVLVVSGFVLGVTLSWDVCLEGGLEGSVSLAVVVGMSFSDFDIPPPGLSPLRMSVPGDGGDENSLYELSV